jgi:hypothetical protein
MQGRHSPRGAEKVPPLLAEGGYIPILDGRVRVDIPFDN